MKPLPAANRYFQLSIYLLLIMCCLGTVGKAEAESCKLRETGERTSDSQTIIIRGVGAGAFNPDYWTTSPPHLVADVRHPLLKPGIGKFRNIYAPSAVARPDGGWYFYYGGWDGIEEGRDAIYATTTADFLSFGDRNAVILPGPFQHVCNVNAQFAAAGGGGVTLMCTVFPDANDRNKPGLFHLSLPVPENPVVASPKDFVTVRGYGNYPDADINGMNVLLRDGNRSLLYFGDFRNFGQISVAMGDAASTSTFDWKAVALDERLAVNDVKILRDARGEKHYLMGLHMNRGELYYSLARDPLRFPAAKELLRSDTDADKYMVALGWVTDSDSELGSKRVLGVLYGAGWSATLDTNRIFAQWIQKRLQFRSSEGAGENSKPEVAGALGPDAVVLSARSESWTGDIAVMDEGGKNQGEVKAVTLQAGRVYELR